MAVQHDNFGIDLSGGISDLNVNLPLTIRWNQMYMAIVIFVLQFQIFRIFGYVGGDICDMERSCTLRREVGWQAFFATHI